MFDFFRRRKRLVVSAAVGAAGAAAAYYWWRAPEAASYAQGSASEDFPACGQHAAQRDFKNKESDSGQRCDEEEEAEEGVEEPESIDASMNAYFDSIQDSFVPTEVQQLMSKLQGKVAEMTDVAAHMQLLPPSTDTQEKLRLVVRLCLAHAFGSVWLLSVVEAFTQMKLNIIGRHLFLQEKLAKLARPEPPLPSWPFSPSPQQLHHHPSRTLPPQLDPCAVEAFLSCDSFSTHGCQWLLFKVMSGVEVMLRQMSVAKEVGPPELLHLLESMLVAIQECIGTAVNWADVLVGTDAMTQASKLHLEATTSGMDPPQAVQAAASVEELHAELRDALCSRKFSSALHASVRHTFHSFAAQLSASLSPSPLPPPPVPQSSISPAHTDQSRAPASASQHHCGDELYPIAPSTVQTRSEQGSTSFLGGGRSMGSTLQGGPIEMQPLGNSGVASSVQGWSPQPGSAVAQQASSLLHQQQQLQTGAGGIGGAAAQQQLSQQTLAAGIGGTHRLPEASLPRMPLAKAGKHIRGTADALLANAGPLSKELSSLQPLKALAASIFAAPSGFSALS